MGCSIHMQSSTSSLVDVMNIYVFNMGFMDVHPTKIGLKNL